MMDYTTFFGRLLSTLQGDELYFRHHAHPVSGAAAGDHGKILLRQSHHEDIPVLIGGNIGSAAYQKHR